VRQKSSGGRTDVSPRRYTTSLVPRKTASDTTAKLQVDGEGGKLTLCQVVVRKNRITTVTVSALDRPPRCQCGRTGIGDARTCIG